jgi:beta-lactamase superfamily II metal-dependent hydrolase
MSIVKSFSVGNGDMFCIYHDSDNFSIIDCCLNDDNRKRILEEISTLSNKKGITRFISTHPDEDHIRGLEFLGDEIEISNFYAVKNKATKTDESASFKRYCELRDHKEKSFNIYHGCSREWMNQSNDERKSSGIDILWPKTENEEFKKALEEAESGVSPNNISTIIKYYEGGARFLWMGDMETEFMNKIKYELLGILTEIDILFAPHHGRNTGRVPKIILEKLNPKIIVIGEGNSEDLNYYSGYKTITQNSAGDITFECEQSAINIFTSKKYDVNFLQYRFFYWLFKNDNYNYLGTLFIKAKMRLI